MKKEKEPFQGLVNFSMWVLVILGVALYLSAIRSQNFWDVGFRVIGGVGLMVGIPAGLLWRRRRHQREEEEALRQSCRRMEEIVDRACF